MFYRDGAAIHRLRHLYVSWFSQLERLFEHLVDTADSEVILSLINETLYELWHSSCAGASSGALNEWILRCAVKQAQRFVRQQPASLPVDGRGHTMLSPLPVEERAVIYLTYSGHSRVQVASIVRLACEEVDRLLARARARLRDRAISSPDCNVTV